MAALPSTRDFYRATTASARVAQLATATSTTTFPDAAAAAATRPEPAPPPPQLRAQRALHRPQPLRPVRATPPPPSQKRVRVVLEKRLIRGSAVFRPPTERDIDDFLRLESSRQMHNCTAASVDLPPVSSPLCARCAASLSPPLPSHTLLPPLPDVPFKTHSLDMAHLAALDECTAVALFLRRLRAHRRHMLFGMQAHHMYPPDKLPHIRFKTPPLPHPRSLSADYPTPMLPSSPHLSVSAHCCASPLLFANPRARSELLPSPPSVSDARSPTPTSRHAASTLTNYSVSRMPSSKSPPVDTPRLQLESSRSRSCDHHEDDDTVTTAAPLRILTAIEPVDPTGALAEAELCRGSSYHVTTARLELPLFRRRRRTSTAGNGDHGFLNKLQRLRSFRRRSDAWSSIVRRLSHNRDVHAR